MILHKAKTLKGKWVMGDHIKGHPHHQKNGNETIVQDGCIYNEINPSTLCQQVPTKDWFVGDEVRCYWDSELFGESTVAHIYFNEDNLQYYLHHFENERGQRIDIYEPLSEFEDDSIKPTGKNKHDDL